MKLFYKKHNRGILHTERNSMLPKSQKHPTTTDISWRKSLTRACKSVFHSSIMCCKAPWEGMIFCCAFSLTLTRMRGVHKTWVCDLPRTHSPGFGKKTFLVLIKVRKHAFTGPGFGPCYYDYVAWPLCVPTFPSSVLSFTFTRIGYLQK